MLNILALAKSIGQKYAILWDYCLFWCCNLQQFIQTDLSAGNKIYISMNFNSNVIVKEKFFKYIMS